METPTDFTPGINALLNAYWPVLLLAALLMLNVIAGDPVGEWWRHTGYVLKDKWIQYKIRGRSRNR
jgi:hypothetical protein